MGGSYGFPQLVSPESPRIFPTTSGLPPSQWFAIETKVRFEKKVVAQLSSKGFQVFLPLSTELHQWTDRQKTITIPLFPGYAFVFLDQSKDSSRAVLQTAGLIRFVSFGGILPAVPQKQIEDLQLLLR